MFGVFIFYSTRTERRRETDLFDKEQREGKTDLLTRKKERRRFIRQRKDRGALLEVNELELIFVCILWEKSVELAFLDQ